ncbi:MAG: hypothetical protein R3355_12780 [Pseudomonas sp.]|uniref:hypothetical protein n=1 Tax=Pseudomonas sp. TaxID=306 RepID=UPI00299EF9CF|nr:hypothetical protein [Pseudomonas sp.]MDX1723964.1 hypothetical protein [Pseudomonas sp.]
MSLDTLRTLLADKLNGQNPSAVLGADKPTSQQPMALFDIEEQTEQFLAIQPGDASSKGLLTGVLGGVGFVFALLAAKSFYSGGYDESVLFDASIAVALFFIPFLWEVWRPLSLPILFNRRTREVYFQQDNELFHTPWDGIAAAAYEFHMMGPYTGGTRNAALEVLIHRLGQPEQRMLLSLGLPMGKSVEMQQGFWEYLRAYMNNGPWFDEQGNHSESDEFVKSQLAVRYRPSKVLRNTWDRILEKRQAAGGKNYLDLSDAVMLLGTVVLHPMGVIQEFTYNVAKRRSRKQWPELVEERLRPDGPTTRLIDLERERGLDV